MLACIPYYDRSTMPLTHPSIGTLFAIIIPVAIVLPACSTTAPYQDWGHKLQSVSQYGGTKRDVSMMFGAAPKYCQAVPGKHYLLGINFDTARGSNHINFVQQNSPAHKLGMKAGERVSSVDGKHVSSYADIREILPEPLTSNRPVTISTDRDTYTVTPGMAKVEQCYWDTRDGNMSEINKGEVSTQGPQERSFRATCRITEGYVTACSWSQQDASTN